ncbi:amino acid ABC transporter substrate-binding protein [Rubrivivax benzoatilyticus]|uniref:Amino acid ABC transporter substrate-binding protein n=1 Tax=Rubrivivax benzoatilyticus TaxID=316997 RepID=A0ABX0HVG9_9BURK|nr:amino acid ABC transporter substrate-binding protein [Rubrivivax benzoatilyticus]EGJ09600.1 extracellular solute-binding protein family 3 [Rubrivivax benzoatilyticus JA2 = ATCC BAA-35]NHK98598.1 amino acid ABC transporter substrate-binding protein [Rubrivivax benzoatilyticus]NHL24100.1 amino acid ABC transporter substrate-binding protein [Rubrivivax benzoatilyticus]
MASLRFGRLAVITLLAACGVASAQTPGDTLSRIKSTKTITLGVREAARPFSFLDENKRPVGYSVDLCLAAVDELKRELKLPELQVQYKVVSGAERIPKLLAREIDLECGSTTNTKARQEQVAFSYTMFVAQMRVLTPKDTPVTTLKDLDGLPLALSKGTTSEKLFTRLAETEVNLKLQVFPSNTEAYAALKAGKVRAFAQDDALLQGLASADGAADKFQLSTLALSVEPYGVMARKDDKALLAAVDRTLGRLYASGEADTLYRKWFVGDKLAIRMSRMTRDSILRPNKEAGVAMVLGYQL